MLSPSLLCPFFYLSPPDIAPLARLDCISSNRKPRVAVLRQEGSNGDREMAAAFWRAGFEAWDVTMTDLIDGCVPPGNG